LMPRSRALRSTDEIPPRFSHRHRTSHIDFLLVIQFSMSSFLTRPHRGWSGRPQISTRDAQLACRFPSAPARQLMKYGSPFAFGHHRDEPAGGRRNVEGGAALMAPGGPTAPPFRRRERADPATRISVPATINDPAKYRLRKGPQTWLFLTSASCRGPAHAGAPGRRAHSWTRSMAIVTSRQRCPSWTPASSRREAPPSCMGRCAVR
jgi:hypothetical protein